MTNIQTLTKQMNECIEHSKWVKEQHPEVNHITYQYKDIDITVLQDFAAVVGKEITAHYTGVAYFTLMPNTGCFIYFYSKQKVKKTESWELVEEPTLEPQLT